MNKPNFAIERSFSEKLIIAVDEVGRGPLAGPVVAAALAFWQCDFNDLSFELEAQKYVNDSKKLSLKKREMAVNFLKNKAIWEVNEVSNEKIDEVNVLEATKIAMFGAVNNLIAKIKPENELVVLVDGNQKPVPMGRSSDLNFQMIIKGDSKSLSIAAASIIAKIHRDRIMAEYAKEFPFYGWENNAAYGTREHLDGLSKHGPCKYHRFSFKPIKELV